MKRKLTDDEGFLSQGLTKLDNRVKKNAKSGISARERSYGVALDAAIPPSSAKSWMTSTATNDQDEIESPENPQSGSELFSDWDEERTSLDLA